MKLTNIKVADCKLSETNIKGRNEGKSFEELVESIKEKGVLVPVLARETKPGKYEVIAGNRRLAAAKEAGLKEIPAQIVKMTDIEAHEAQIVENLQREDIHPLDEGSAYRRLVEEAKYDTKSIAAKVGKPESYIKQRLFLTNLITPASDAYRAGKIIDGHAVLIARLATADQEKALKAATNRFESMTVKELKEWIQENIYTQLENQPWVGDPKDMEAVGKCVECEPNKATLFGPVKEGTCTSLKCWARKMQNYIDWKVKEGKLAKICSEYGQAPKGVYAKSEYVLVAKSGKDRCKSVHQAIVVEGAEIGKIFDICTDKDCQTHRGMKSQYGMTPAEQEARRKSRKADLAKAKKAKEDRKDRLETALAKVKWPMREKHLGALLALALEICSANAYRNIAKRRALEVKKEKDSWGTGTHYDYSGAVKSAVTEMSRTEKLQLAFELLIDTGYDSLRTGIGQL